MTNLTAKRNFKYGVNINYSVTIRVTLYPYYGCVIIQLLAIFVFTYLVGECEQCQHEDGEEHHDLKNKKEGIYNWNLEKQVKCYALKEEQVLEHSPIPIFDFFRQILWSIYPKTATCTKYNYHLAHDLVHAHVPL